MQARLWQIVAHPFYKPTNYYIKYKQTLNEAKI